MRRAEASSLIVKTSPSTMLRTLRVAIVPLSLGLIMTTGMARAADDDRTFSEKLSDSFFGTIRGTNMDSRGIDYRERSPLVVPPTLDLPPPAAGTADAAPNWPQDPDERRRKAVIAAKKKTAPPPARVRVTNADGTPVVAGAPVQPINIAPPVEDPAAAAAVASTVRPANAADRTNPIYDQPGDLFNGGFAKSVGIGDSLGIGNLFGTKGEVADVAPGTEPARQALTQPPPGYQTPSPNYAYGIAPKGLLDGTANPDRNPLTQRSSATSMQR